MAGFGELERGRNSSRLIEEQISFDQAVSAVVDWVNANSNWGETLLIVTGDHETGYLWGPGSNPTWEPLVNNGADMMPGMAFNSGNHTNSLVHLYAKGDDARLFNSIDRWNRPGARQIRLQYKHCKGSAPGTWLSPVRSVRTYLSG